MTRYVLTRLAHGTVVLWAALTLSFLVLHLVPGDPVTMMLRGGGGEAAATDPALADQLRAEMGLDQPLHVQYVDFVTATLRGDLGASHATGEQVTAMFARALPPTLELALAALLLTVVLGVGVAVAATLAPWAGLRNALLSGTVAGISVPTFWSGILLIQVFSFGLGWFPAYGDGTVAHLVLPAVTLALPTAGVLAQVLARGLRSALAEPYARTARAKGASPTRTVLVHAVRNGSLPALTMVGMMVGSVLAGAIIVETVFSRQGVGSVTVDAINAHDFPVIRAVVFLAGAVYVLVNLAVDLVYPRIDPRIVLRT